MLELGDIIPAQKEDDVERIVKVLAEMQRGINILTGILAGHRKDIAELRQELARLKAAPAPKLITPEAIRWRN